MSDIRDLKVIEAKLERLSMQLEHEEIHPYLVLLCLKETRAELTTWRKGLTSPACSHNIS